MKTYSQNRFNVFEYHEGTHDILIYDEIGMYLLAKFKVTKYKTMDQEIKDKVIAIICDELVCEEHELKDANFKLDLGADSLDVLNIVNAIEKELDIKIPDPIVEEEITTVEELFKAIEDQL